MTQYEKILFEILIKEIPRIRKALEALTPHQNECRDAKIEKALTETFNEEEDEGIWYSCCGVEMTGVLEDIGICPRCKEHTCKEDNN